VPTRESHSLRRCGLRQAQLSQEARHRLDDYVRHARAAGASWQQVGSALGITRQSAWERFRHLCTDWKALATPDGVLQRRHLQPHVFADWVRNAAKYDASIQRWLEEPDIDLGMMAGFNRAVQPVELLGWTTLRDFLMASGYINVATSSVAAQADCPICGRKFLDESFLSSHRERDHRNVVTKPKRGK
jgi:hypothetical protein